jgi:hypothetical protein
MKVIRFAAALALAAALVPQVALADDPGDAAMRNAAARARDAATIKRLNQEQLAKVRARDAGYAAGWQAYRDVPGENARRRTAYERQMAEWRRAVARCNAGDYAYCAR